jgi:hypothetical protein
VHYRVVPPVDDPDLPASETFVAARIEGRVVSSQANPKTNAERGRLAEARVQGVPWRRWDPYRSERQWTFFQTIVTRPSLKGLLSPNGSRRQRLARNAIDQVRRWLR